MRTLRELAAGKAACRELAQRGRLGFVPTMGALHEGHLSLVRRARQECDAVAVSIFVNPLQFGPQEDLQRYPRPEAQDERLLAAADVDLLLRPSPEEMYPPGFATRLVQPPECVSILEGAQRKGHFEGVLTVVCKLLHIAAASRAYFGRKDYQQSVLVRRMVADLDLPTEIVLCPTVRDRDGLALSSRNAFLDGEGRRRGLSLVAALRRAEQLFEAGQRSAATLLRAMEEVLCEGLGHAPDYASVVDAELRPRPEARAGDTALVAGRVGEVRLIDNHVLGDKLGPFVPDAGTCSVS